MVLLIYTVGLSSCNREEPKTLNSKKLTGEELFREIVLIDSKNIDKKIPEYSQVVEELRTLTPEELKARKIFNDYITQEVKNNYPDYFAKLKEAIYSKQLYAIKQAFNEGRNALINTLRLSNKYGGLLKSIEKFAKQNAENYNINSKDGQDRFINDLASYLEISNIDSNEQGRGFLINKAAGIFMHVVIAVDFVAAVNTFLLRQSPGFFNDQNNIFFEKVVVSISKNY
ncbi:MAG: hypothetical protein ACQPRJ_05835 [Solitalea-like symbiont of Acarus siro]